MMRDNPYKDLKGTIHWANRTGVRATCPDCHVPHNWFYKIRRKIAATNELYHFAVGTVDTPEKFETHKLALATARLGNDERHGLARVPQLSPDGVDGP